MGKARVRPGWSVYWPPASSQQQIYGPGEIVEFEGEAPQIQALEILPDEEEGDPEVEDKKKELDKPPVDKMARPGKQKPGSQSIVKK